jgi:predicted Fe-Mo cluster-binding NifX family protein
MRVCIPIESDQGIESTPYGHFGSAPCFLIYDTDQDTWQVQDNSDQHHAHGMCHPLQALTGQSVDAVVVGGIGLRAIERLNQMRITVYQAVAGSVKDNIDAIKAGQLQVLGPANACQHDHGAGPCH